MKYSDELETDNRNKVFVIRTKREINSQQCLIKESMIL